MTAKGEKITYKARIKPSTVTAFVEMAQGLEFFVHTKGRYYGDPSLGDMLDKLAESYREAPEKALAALALLGVTGKGEPPKK